MYGYDLGKLLLFRAGTQLKSRFHRRSHYPPRFPCRLRPHQSASRLCHQLLLQRRLGLPSRSRRRSPHLVSHGQRSRSALVHHHQLGHLYSGRGTHDRCLGPSWRGSHLHRSSAHRLGRRRIVHDHPRLRRRVQSRAHPWKTSRSLRSRCAVWYDGKFFPCVRLGLADCQVGFWIPYAVLQTQKGTVQWRLPFALQLIPAVACIVAMWFLKESPRFTAKKFGQEKGMSSPTSSPVPRLTCSFTRSRLHPRSSRGPPLRPRRAQLHHGTGRL